MKVRDEGSGTSITPKQRTRIQTPGDQEFAVPPPFRLVKLGEVGDAFGHACAHAAELGAGALVFVGRFDVAEFAVVLETEGSRPRAGRSARVSWPVITGLQTDCACVRFCSCCFWWSFCNHRNHRGESSRPTGQAMTPYRRALIKKRGEKKRRSVRLREKVHFFADLAREQTSKLLLRTCSAGAINAVFALEQGSRRVRR